MGKDETGEHSRKNPDGDDERPFKKARYVWQLKGKYHLKDSYKQSGGFADVKGGSSRDAVDEASPENTTANNNNGSIDNNNCNKCCLDTLLAHSNALLESEDSSDQDASNNIDRAIHDEIPVTLVKPNPKNHDDFLHKWQARQVAKSFIDNTINSILEQWKMAPSDAADFVEHCESGGQVEDEGILMAIQSHGLQSGVRYSAAYENGARLQGESSRSSCDLSISIDNSAPVTFLKSSYMDESTLDNFENVHNEIMKQKTTDAEMSCDSDNFGDQMDFLSAAVSVAIQKKGLSSYNYG